MTRAGRHGSAALLAIVLSALAGGATPVTVDRAVVSFVAHDTGGVAVPRFVYERQLAFEARIEALTEGEVREGDPPYRTRHLRAALDRHIAESVLTLSRPFVTHRIKRMAPARYMD